jgi:hypothetical protein
VNDLPRHEYAPLSDTRGWNVIRAFVLYDGEPDPQLYAEHVDLCRRVPGVTFRHGRVFGAPRGEPRHRYYAEFEWPDMDAFRAAARSPEFAETGRHGATLGVPFSVEFVDVT